jgi:haloalkane dehalogenase
MRTPEERFEGLPDFDYEPHYRQLGDLRLAHVEAGDGPPVVFIHGAPTWSFLWRKVIPPVRDAGFRAIAPDLVGCGRSDKPTDFDWYSYTGHTEICATLFEDLDLRQATVVVHDWGGPIGLRLAVEHPDRIERIVVMDSGVFNGRQEMPEAWIELRDFVERTEDLPVSMLVRRGCRVDPGDEVGRAYDAPFPDVSYKIGVRAFPLLIPLSPEARGAAAGQRVIDALKNDLRPRLMLWADSDPVLPTSTGERFAEMISARPPHVIPDAGHFLQEDQGPLVGKLIAEWLDSEVPWDRRSGSASAVAQTPATDA